jgi:hypothetical protein
LAFLVGQNEIRHRLARPRRVLADVVLSQPGHEVIDRLLKVRTEASHRVGEGLQSLGKRRIHVSALDERFVELL